MPPFDNVKVRQAAGPTRLTVRPSSTAPCSAYGTPIGTHFAPHNPAYVDLTGQSAYDPEKAKALLAEAGFADGFETTLHLPPPSYGASWG